MQLQFLGATGTVTGSKYLLRHGDATILVDCGLFQGFKQLRLRNWEPLPVAPKTVDAVVLTHAHIDHSGYLPLLARQGFRGRVYCTSATHELCKILLTDSGHLQEEEAKFANRHGFSKHQPALPLYTREDAERCLKLFAPRPFSQDFAAGFTARPRRTSCARSCSPTAAICRRKRRSSPTGTVSPNTSPRCRCTPVRTPSAA